MDPKLVKLAKEIPTRLKDVMNSMFEQSQPALRSGVSALRDSLRKLDVYLGDVEKEHLGSESGRRGPGRPARSAAAAAEPVVRRRRSRGRFPISEFVLAELGKASEPMRPVEIAEKVAEQTGRTKENALGNVNTLLSRLRKTKKVVSRNGLYRLGTTGMESGAGVSRAPRRRRARSAGKSGTSAS